MKYIANILTNSKLDVSSFFHITSNFEEIDKTLPTLIIGWGEVKKLFPEQNILKNEIEENLYWTFSKREKRYKYEQDLENFIKKVTDNINNKINYHFFNYLLANTNKRVSFINYINKGFCSIYYNSRFLYIYCIKDEITLGISLKDLNYIGINSKDFINSLLNQNNNIICDNLKCIDNNSFNLIKDNVKIIAYLNYLKNADIYI